MSLIQMRREKGPMSHGEIHDRLKAAGRIARIEPDRVHFNDFAAQWGGKGSPSKWPKWVHDQNAREEKRPAGYKHRSDLTVLLQDLHAQRIKRMGVDPGVTIGLPTVRSMRRVTDLVNRKIPERLELLKHVTARL